MSIFWIAVVAMSLLGLAPGAILGYVFRRSVVEDDPVVEKIDKILPQSQCDQCDHPGRRPYTEAISCNDGKIDRCTSGGEVMVLKVAKLFNAEPQSLGGEAPKLAPARMMAVTGENNCVGCIKHIQACPVDIIVGATRVMHTVVSDLCTGCDLCVDSYPTHCISLQPVVETSSSQEWDLNTIPVYIIPVEHHA